MTVDHYIYITHMFVTSHWISPSPSQLIPKFQQTTCYSPSFKRTETRSSWRSPKNLFLQHRIYNGELAHDHIEIQMSISATELGIHFVWAHRKLDFFTIHSHTFALDVMPVSPAARSPLGCIEPKQTQLKRVEKTSIYGSRHRRTWNIYMSCKQMCVSVCFKRPNRNYWEQTRKNGLSLYLIRLSLLSLRSLQETVERV